MDKFKMEIDLGNDAMQTSADVAAAIRNVAEKLENKHGIIYDLNGNRVGSWLWGRDNAKVER